MDASTLESFRGIVTTVMLIAVGVLAFFCGLLILRSVVLGSVSRNRRRRAKSDEEEEKDRLHRQRTRSWFWHRE